MQIVQYSKKAFSLTYLITILGSCLDRCFDTYMISGRHVCKPHTEIRFIYFYISFHFYTSSRHKAVLFFTIFYFCFLRATKHTTISSIDHSRNLTLVLLLSIFSLIYYYFLSEYCPRKQKR